MTQSTADEGNRAAVVRICPLGVRRDSRLANAPWQNLMGARGAYWDDVDGSPPPVQMGAVSAQDRSGAKGTDSPPAEPPVPRSVLLRAIPVWTSGCHNGWRTVIATSHLVAPHELYPLFSDFGVRAGGFHGQDGYGQNHIGATDAATADEFF